MVIDVLSSNKENSFVNKDYELETSNTLYNLLPS